MAEQLLECTTSGPGVVAPAGRPIPPPEPDLETPGVPLRHYWFVLRRHAGSILAFVAASVAATVIVSSRMTPVYEATVTVDVDRQSPTGVIGQEAVRTVSPDADQFLATQIKLIQSDSVLRPVVDKYRLREIPGEVFEDPPERPEEAAEAPVRLRHLKVTRPPNTYLLLISFRSSDPKLAAAVANAVAGSYLEHTYKIRYRASASLSAFMEKQLEELRAKMERSSAALAAFERELNVINPEEKTSILSARLLQLNSEYTQAQAERMRKEAAWQSVRGGTLEAAQVSTQGDALRKLAERLNEARERFAEVRAHYGANHPEYRKAFLQLQEIERVLAETRQSIAERVRVEYQEAVRREEMLRKAVAETKAEFDSLNARSFEYQALKREAETDKKLYDELLHKIREAGINASFQNSSIRIADPARPPLKPVFPNLKLNVVIALLASTLLAAAVAVVRDLMDDTVRDPEQVPRLFHAEVIGALPSVKGWRRIPAPLPAAGGALVRAGDPGDLAVAGFEEAVRALRNSILLGDLDRRLRSILVTSAFPGEGKSTVAAHLAATHAAQGRRTLLVDGDLRRPTLHRRFGVPGALGLANVLVSELPWREAVIPVEATPGLDLLPAGPPSRRAADRMGAVLSELLAEASLTYDLVILDAPPALGFAEPLEMAAVADGVVIVARAGQTSRKAIAGVLAVLRRVRAEVVGLVLNEVRKDSDGGYYYYGRYQKYYRRVSGES
jgi:capsular exopolysaccharide synthesis family protein